MAFFFFFPSSVQHYNFSGFNNSDRSPQRPVTALRGETSFWQLQVSGWWVEEPIEWGMLGQCLSGQSWRPYWARLQPNAGQTDSPSSRRLKPGKPAGMPAHVTYLVECPLGKTPRCYSRGGLHDFKHFASQCLSSLLIKTMWHSSCTYMELWN